MFPTTVFNSRLDHFHRRKVGSIRDNPKLLKIRQQFENACQETNKFKTIPKDVGGSAPSSFSLSKSADAIVLDQLLKMSPKYSEKTEACIKGKLDLNSNRRNSEGDIKVQKSFSMVIYENAPSLLLDVMQSSSSLQSVLPDSKTIGPRVSPLKNNKYRTQNSSSDSGVHTNSSASEEDCVSNTLKLFGGNAVDKDANKFFRPIAEPAPPIPRRGISAAFQSNFVLSHSSPSRKNNKESSDSNSQNSVSSIVQNVIQLYEGMSSSNPKKTKLSKSFLRRDDSFSSRRSFLQRRSSRRNSLRNSKHLTHKDLPSSKSPTKRKEPSFKEDNSCNLSDSDDKTQGIYQTLTTTVNVQQQASDPYDRLNRLHDVVNGIHKGQATNCAACKAIPSNVHQYRTDDSSIMQVKCNELGPHHHPPCICFACQHSIFSCSEGIERTPSRDHIVVDEDSLYYNVCCLNSRNREGWRQSRRRPVCEQNGRLCIVNCDMEKCTASCGENKSNGTFYAKLSDCHSVSPEPKGTSCNVSVHSCDSDEALGYFSESDDEKTFISKKSFINPFNFTALSTESGDVSVEDGSLGLNHLVAKCKELDLSRTLSTEHLYESISELSTENIPEETLPKEPIPTSPDDVFQQSPPPLKDDQSPENELDSGEWSTESASSTCDDQFSKENIEQNASSTLNQCRFMVNYECQESAKKTFMKSVLGKKTAVNVKKKRMSNFFVPWLLSNQEFGPAKSHKGNLLKQNTLTQLNSPKSAHVKDKRSQSIPMNSPKLSFSCTKVLSSSSELLDEHKNNEDDIEDNFLSLPDGPPSVSSRESDVSSAYIRTDQLNLSDNMKASHFAPIESSVDVTVEKIRKRSASGSSDHTYIVFQPVTEEDVPLYQFYERNIKERVSFCRSPPGSLSPEMWASNAESPVSEVGPKLTSPQRSVVEQLSPETQDMKMQWCELSEVKDSGILERISAQELKLQEAFFEFIQSHASYTRSLKVLQEKFINTPEFSSAYECASCVLSRHEQDVLFGDIVRIKEVSERLMCRITERWGDGVLIPDICEIIQEHVIQPEFTIYVKYCSSRVYQERTLKELKETRLCFLEVLRKLESNPGCQGLSLESFLFLPMQHIARLPLLLDNIFRWLSPDSPSHRICNLALETVHKVFVDCNKGARKMERLEEIVSLNKQIEFKECKFLPIISASRWLLKKGELTRLDFDKKTFGRSSRCIRVSVFLFLFNDLLIVTKKKSDDVYTVVDYCHRGNIQACIVNSKDLQQPVVVPNTCRYLLYLTLQKNHQNAAVDYILSCSLLSERTRWIEAITDIPQNKPCEEWEYDCPQVQCVRSYIAQQPDELSLQESDVVTIHRKMNDGWYEGRRLRDGLQGWFPASYTMDIPCSRARASNIRQCYRLLMLSQEQ